MTQTQYFPIQGFEAIYSDGTVELRHSGVGVMWMTFFQSGVFTVREPGRGHAGRFPTNLAVDDVRERVAYALRSFERRAA